MFKKWPHFRGEPHSLASRALLAGREDEEAFLGFPKTSLINIPLG